MPRYLGRARTLEERLVLLTGVSSTVFWSVLVACRGWPKTQLVLAWSLRGTSGLSAFSGACSVESCVLIGMPVALFSCVQPERTMYEERNRLEENNATYRHSN